MPKATNTLHKVPNNEVLKELADLLVVPLEQRAFFFESIYTSVQTAWELDGLAKPGLAAKRGEALVVAALTIYDTLGNLNTRERKLIEGVFGKAGSIFSRISKGGVPGLEKTAYQLALLTTLVTGKPPPRYRSQLPEPPGKGRRLGSIEDPIFRQFTWDLLISITTAGGDFTFQKQTPRGTLVEAIKKLAHHLPPGFVPNPLPGSTVQRVIDSHKRVVNALDELEQDSVE